MELEEHEIPKSLHESDDGAELQPGDITDTNRNFYTIVVSGLLAALLFGMVAWFVLALRGDDMPEGMAVLVGSVGGGLVGLISTSK